VLTLERLGQGMRLENSRSPQRRVHWRTSSQGQGVAV